MQRRLRWRKQRSATPAAGRAIAGDHHQGHARRNV